LERTWRRVHIDGRGIVMKLYFVVTDKTSEEVEVIRQLRPPQLLASYFYFRVKGIGKLIEKIGYTPEILLDSGAFSAWNTGKNISIIDYMAFIDANKKYIGKYIALDVVGDADLTRWYYEIMRFKGYEPIPVFHYGDDFEYLDYYLEKGERTIALGGSAKMRSKPTVAAWCSDVIGRHPEINFHLLGSSSRQITDHCDLSSCDSSTWIIGAFNGRPKHIPGKTRASKVARAEWNMRKLMDEYKEVI
jgi:hypothetical protein